MKQRIQHPFNMIEIVISLVIILVLLIGVLSLIPKSLETNTNAMNRIASADATEQFLNYLQSRVTGNWEVELVAFPDALAECASETNAQFSLEGDTVGQRLLPNTNIVLMHNAANQSAAYDPTQVGGLFKITQRTASNITDFEAVVRVWKKVDVLSEGGEADLSQARSCELFAEVSWPVTAAYADRNKSVASITVFRPGQSFAQAPEAEEDCISTGQVGGTINLNPSNNRDFSFDMTTTDDQLITRGDLLANGNGYTFSGTVSYIRFRPKGNGNQNSLTLNGETMELENKHTYELRGPAIQVSLRNSRSGNGTSIGTWYLDIGNSTIEMDYDCLSDPSTEVEEEETAGLFDIVGGAVVPQQSVRTTFRMLGCALTSGGRNMPVQVNLTIDDETISPWGDSDLNNGQQYNHDAGVIEAGKEISVTGRSYRTNGSFYMEKSSSPANQNVLVLRNGDSVPDIQGFDGQDNLEGYIQSYIDTDTNTVTLADNQAIYLFELGTTNMNSPSADFQDMVMLVTMTPEE